MIKRTDKELLELAAKAAGYGDMGLFYSEEGNDLWDGEGFVFAPLTDDADALRLAVKLHLDITMYPVTKEIGAVQHFHNGVCSGVKNRVFQRTDFTDPMSAARRAITIAAAATWEDRP